MVINGNIFKDLCAEAWIPELLFVYLGIIKKIKVMQVLRFFKDELTGDECAIAWNGTEEICITADEAYNILAEEQAAKNAYENGRVYF